MTNIHIFCDVQCPPQKGSARLLLTLQELKNVCTHSRDNYTLLAMPEYIRVPQPIWDQWNNRTLIDACQPLYEARKN